ncbi:endonuclease/exonuclease/phosphatase family protein [Streptomyces rubiginosohelvolus]|uniref:endonuclease/exonuclease/phosphatase family protein n=1 Tax=Streptomyces rubiginosohelvolus TaxID=67362 RepID=UPI0038118821
MRQFRKAWLGAACALFALASSASIAQAETGQAAASSAGTYNVWQWNVAGNTYHGGRSDTNMVSLASTSMVNRDADFAAFNELCRGQYDELINQLRGKNWPQDDTNFARFEASRQAGDPDVCGGDAYGNAIFSKRPLGTADRLTLTSDGTREARNMLCAPLANGSGVRFCGTHLTTVNAIKYKQIDDIRNYMENRHKDGEKVLTAGDLNVQPHYPSMNSVYSAAVSSNGNVDNFGAYRELDDADASNCLGYGETTTDIATTGNPCGRGPKLDFILVRETALASASSYSADTLATSTDCTPVKTGTNGLCSDHRIVTGTVTLR